MEQKIRDEIIEKLMLEILEENPQGLEEEEWKEKVRRELILMLLCL